MAFVLGFYLAQWIPYFVLEVFFPRKCFEIAVWIAFFADACFDTMIFAIRVGPVKEVFTKGFYFLGSCCSKRKEAYQPIENQND